MEVRSKQSDTIRSYVNNLVFKVFLEYTSLGGSHLALDQGYIEDEKFVCNNIILI